jgi:hypothetical protein
MSMPSWGDMFRLSTPILEIVVRGTVMFLAIYAMMRVAGKREAGSQSLTDLLVVVLVAEAAAHGMAGDAAHRRWPDQPARIPPRVHAARRDSAVGRHRAWHSAGAR